MTEPLPCPFCGHVGLSHYEGLTFRWLTTECNGCGAQCGEERINTMTMERSAAIEQAKVEAIKAWNTRAALEQQQAEFDCPRCGHVCSQRPWVGLTDEEMSDTVADIDVDFGDLLWKVVCLTKIIESKLKERNT